MTLFQQCAIIHPVMRKFGLLLILAIGLGSFSACQTASSTKPTEAPALSSIPSTPGFYNMFLEYQGQARGYVLVIPSGYKPGKPTPLILVFHGSGQDASAFAHKRDELLAHADREGFILVFPQALVWDGKARWSPLRPEDGVYTINDAGFINRLLEDLQANLSIDNHRIYAAGFSSGGTFVHFLGAASKNVFAALAVVASSLNYNLTQPNGEVQVFLPPAPQDPTPILLINGRRDPYLPWEGGVNSLGGQVTSVEEMVRFWVDANGCDIRSNVEMLSNKAGSLTRFSSCAENSEVVLVTLELMDHRWPDRSADFLFDANRAIIEFFKKHAR